LPDIRLPSLNIVILSGRLTSDPELRYTASGRAVSRFRMAASRAFRDREGEWQEETLFIDVTAWGALAERVNTRLTKGSPLLIQGFLRSRSWETETGAKRTAVEIIARNIQFLEKVEPQEPESVTEEIPSEEKEPEENEDLPF